MNTLARCLTCGSDRLIRNIAPGRYQLVFTVTRRREKKILGVFDDDRASRTTAVVCGVCGYVHLFATELDNLRDPGDAGDAP